MVKNDSNLIRSHAINMCSDSYANLGIFEKIIKSEVAVDIKSFFDWLAFILIVLDFGLM